MIFEDLALFVMNVFITAVAFLLGVIAFHLFKEGHIGMGAMVSIMAIVIWTMRN